MSLTASVFADRPQLSTVPMDSDFGMESPFGLQGLTRDTIEILKPDCINKLAVDLALRGTHEDIRDPEFVKRVLSYHPDWIDEYRIVHLIEKSLWIQGHSDLVMTMTKNPARIPDNPPERILDALTQAITLHPDATFWYGVPLFSDEKNADGLPIPVTAAEVRKEAEQRLAAAQEQALKWGWVYRAALEVVRIPSKVRTFGRAVLAYCHYVRGRIGAYWNRVQAEARNRLRASIKSDLEHCRLGRRITVVPENSTVLGRSLETGGLILELIAYRASFAAQAIPLLSAMAGPLAVASYIPVLFVPITIVSVDPFLFVELPDEPGKLRHIGHWYWQSQGRGKQKLHLHI